jgi:hypothetical protein
VQQFFGALPTVWDDTRFVSGYPGESVVLARRHGDTWYVAGINGTDNEKTLAVPLNFIKGKTQTMLFADGTPWTISSLRKLPHQVTCKPRGGFVMVIERH